jgi:hypothetical protein
MFCAVKPFTIPLWTNQTMLYANTHIYKYTTIDQGQLTYDISYVMLMTVLSILYARGFQLSVRISVCLCVGVCDMSKEREASWG